MKTLKDIKNIEGCINDKNSRPISRAIKDAINQKSSNDLKSLSSIGQ
jgi:hypothetical protein